MCVLYFSTIWGFRIGSKRLRSWKVQKGVFSFDIDSTGTTLATKGVTSTKILLWELKSQKQIGVIQSTSPISPFTFLTQKELITVEKDGRVLLWDLKTMKSRTLVNSRISIRSMIASKERLFLIAEKGDLYQLNLKNKKLKKVIADHSGGAVCVAANFSLQLVATANSEEIKLWRLSDFKLLKSISNSSKLK